MSEAEKGRIVPTNTAGASRAGTERAHTVTLTERADVAVTGVIEVLSFDESSVLLRTAVGDLALEGTGLRVHTLDVEGGRLAVSGEVQALYYSERQEGDRRARRGRPMK